MYGPRAAASPSERRSWDRSIPVLADDLVEAGLGDVEVLLEHRLPLSSRRVDAILAGRHPVTGAASYVVVELKQWSGAELYEDDPDAGPYRRIRPPSAAASAGAGPRILRVPASTSCQRCKRDDENVAGVGVPAQRDRDGVASLRQLAESGARSAVHGRAPGGVHRLPAVPARAAMQRRTVCRRVPELAGRAEPPAAGGGGRRDPGPRAVRAARPAAARLQPSPARHRGRAGRRRQDCRDRHRRSRAAARA